MELNVQKRIAADVLKCSAKRVWFDEDHLDEIKEAITKADLRSLISKGMIRIKPAKVTSRGRARHRRVQKSKGRRKGQGSRKGKAGARLARKDNWKNMIRAQRDLIKYLKEEQIISRKDYRMLYSKCKGGFFRSRRHIRLFIEEKNLAKKPLPKQKAK
ncbi:50S ribosomal protein L19e [Candidatus Woesearchaeota archaeon CG10_big_fil_rev_8_21_14_0_10_44_13]|nr:MAG: 50S ribosomal protein L19e [Candidatus Woesearchaeota archaeon CG10_big_fil_rev_8_21_14_0_10_44_13]